LPQARGSLRRAALLIASLLVSACEIEEPAVPARDPFQLLPAASSLAPTPAVTLGPFRIEHDPPPMSTPGPLVSVSPSAEEKPSAAATEPHVEVPLAPAAEPCPDGMALVHGDACTNVREDCLRWEDPGLPLADQKRCAEFAPSKCIGDRKHMRFCIDKTELPEAKGGALPVGDVSWTLAKEMCGARGKRLCNESEWTFACEGEEMRPYPTGNVRDATLCNFDRTDLLDAHGKFVDHRMPTSAFPKCESPFGVLEMVGNVDEWVWREGAWTPWRAGLKGGWWLAGRNRCRPETTGHDEYYHDLQTGVRCCKDAGKG
jgi:hypothetical protein